MKKGTKRILQVFGELQIGGAETFIMNVYRNIDREKYQFDFIVHGTNVGKYESEIKKMGGKIYRIPKYKVYNHFKYKKQVKKILDEHPEYKVIHSHVRSTASIILKVAKKKGLTTICHSHSISNGKGLKSYIKKTLQKSIPKYADYLFACSFESARWLYGDKLSKSDRCYIINNAIDTKKFVYNENIRNKIRKELKVEDKIVIGQIGRLENMKNHSFTLKVFKECIKRNEKYVLLIIGEGSKRDEIKSEISKLKLGNHVMMLGVKSNINELMQAMDLFIMPSLYEGLPLALVEAQASSLPCVISNNISSGIIIPELVKKVSLDIDPKIWASQIKLSLKNKRINRLNYIVDSNFDIDSNTKWLEEFYLNNM